MPGILSLKLRQERGPRVLGKSGMEESVLEKSAFGNWGLDQEYPYPCRPDVLGVGTREAVQKTPAPLSCYYLTVSNKGAYTKNKW